jgi:ribulose-phosphate 3-epimerase
MSVIVPAILPVSQEDLEKKLARLRGYVDAVQIDVIDGRFASPACWPYSNGTHEFAAEVEKGETLPYFGEFHFEMDLMVADPDEVTGIWIAAGAERLVLHVESSNYLPRAITDLEVKYGHAKDFASELLSIGLGINLQSDLSIIEPYLDTADFVQFMGIASIGKQGQPFDEGVVQKIVAFKKKHPTVPIQVDGGVSLRTAPELLSAGVDRLIVGSALWNAPDIANELRLFEELVQEYGTYA